MANESGMEKKLKRLSDSAMKNTERAVKELSKEWEKGELVETGIVNTGRLRHIIQSIKDLKDIAQKDKENRDIDSPSKIYQALEKEDDT